MGFFFFRLDLGFFGYGGEGIGVGFGVCGMWEMRGLEVGV